MVLALNNPTPEITRCTMSSLIFNMEAGGMTSGVLVAVVVAKLCKSGMSSRHSRIGKEGALRPPCRS